jgi:hypothetical protein
MLGKDRAREKSLHPLRGRCRWLSLNTKKVEFVVLADIAGLSLRSARRNQQRENEKAQGAHQNTFLVHEL